MKNLRTNPYWMPPKTWLSKMSPLEHAIAEQRKCADYRGPDIAGAWRGLNDWLMEEVLIRLEMDKDDKYRHRD